MQNERHAINVVSPMPDFFFRSSLRHLMFYKTRALVGLEEYDGQLCSIRIIAITCLNGKKPSVLPDISRSSVRNWSIVKSDQ